MLLVQGRPVRLRRQSDWRARMWGEGDPGGWAQQSKSLSIGVVHCPLCWAMLAAPTASHCYDSHLTSLSLILVGYSMSTQPA